MNAEQYQRLFDIGWLLAIVAICIGLEYLIAPAEALTIAQGDIVFMNETIDVSQAASWPKYQLAWCSPSNTDCDPPDQIIDAANGSLKKFYIDPKTFHYGKYFRWDGAWHAAENAIAFTVIHGRRNTTVAANNTTNTTIIAPAEKDGPFNYLVARGDTATLITRLSEPDNCRLWLFTNTNATYDMPLFYQNRTYTTVLNSTITYLINTGTYPGYIQCAGHNNWQDISYTSNQLDTPYDDRLVPDVPVMEWNLLNARRQFDDLARSIPKFDDVLTPVTIEVVDPTITITNVEQDEDTLFVSGVTTWGDDTRITLQLDPDNYPLERERRFHTWQTSVSGTIDAPRTFNTALPFERKELAVGPHEIVMKADEKASTEISSYTFKVSDVYVMPTPTPETRRMIYGKDYEEIPVKITPTPTPTLNFTEEVVWEEWVTVTPEPNATANVTAKKTTAPVTTQVPKAEKTIPTIPVNAGLAAAAAGIAVAMRGIKE